MERSEVEDRIRIALENLKGCETADEYYYGFKDGVEWLLRLFVEHGLVKESEVARNE